MEDNGFLKRYLSSVFITAGVLLCAPVFVSAYNSEITHPLLTNNSVDLFNKYFNDLKLSEIEKAFVSKGSTDEDSFGRWMAHFYDPVYNKGLSYLGNWESSKEWAQDHKSQSKLDPKMLVASAVLKPFSGSSDYSWERSIYEYAWGNKQRGLEGLGHILHLLQDAAVPDHTRNDPHGSGSPYEGFSVGAKFAEVGEMGKPFFLNSLGEYFDKIGIYSNNNFFSKDTIFDKKYITPDDNFIFERIESLSDGNFYIFSYKILDNVSYRVLTRSASSEWFDNLKSKNDKFFIDDNDDLIFTDYWSRLSKQAVVYGAGVIRLFFSEVEKEKRTKKLLAYNKSPAEKMSAAIVGLFYSPTIRQAQTDPELAEDLGLNWTSLTSETYETDTTLETNLDSYYTPPPIAPEPEKQKVSAPAPQEVSKTPKITSPAMPIAGGGGAPPTEEAIGPISPTEPIEDSDEDEDPPPPAPPAEPPPAEPPEEPPAEPPVDADAPNISYSISECGGSIAENGCLLTSGTNFNLSWSSTSTDLSSYTVECVFGGSSCAGFPISNTTSTSTTTNLSSAGIYSLTFKAKDAADNQSATTTQIEINALPVVINEVGWMGTSADETDEWIEIFNGSNFSINLGDGSVSSWSIAASDGSPNILLNGTISAGGYFVLERTNSSTTSYAENQIFTGAINDLFAGGGDNLVLKNPSGGTVDSTVLVSEVGIVSGTKLPQRKSAERINPFYRGSTNEETALNWRTASSTASAITDKNGSVILGTPGALNSIYNIAWRPTHIKKTDVISSNTTWTTNGSPYIISSSAGQFMTINSDITLTINPGVVAMQYVTSPGVGANQMMRVNGKIVAEGTDAQNIVFTDLLDSDYGGYGGSAKGDWSRIIFSASSLGNSFKKIKFRHGGWYDWMWEIPKPVFDIDPSAGITFDGAVFEKSYNSVFIMSGGGFSGVSIQNSLFTDNGSAPSSASGNIYLENGASPTISGNNFLNNNVYPITMTSSYPDIGSNSAAGNPINGIFVRDNFVFGSNAAWSGTLPYVLESSGGAPFGNRPTVGAGVALAINPGVILKPQNNALEYLKINGVLNWNATAENPGIVTSFKDDSYGGDTNNDGSASSPEVGDLFNNGIHFTNTTATSTLSNILLRYGNPGNEILQDAGALLEK